MCGKSSKSAAPAPAPAPAPSPNTAVADTSNLQQRVAATNDTGATSGSSFGAELGGAPAGASNKAY